MAWNFYLSIHQMPNSPRTAAQRRAANTLAARRARHARVIQARVRGMLTRLHIVNPHTNIGRRAIMAMFKRPNNMRAHGANIRAGIRHGPEHYVASRSTALWRANARASGMSAAARASMKGVNGPRGAVSRRTPSPRRNNNNFYA
jgi:hypothetical protein